MKNSEFDWIVIGGGISGITLSEILSREGHKVLLLEKNDQLATETTKVFHEWMHSGALYSLVPDNLLSMRYLLGATDDLLEYYSCFEKMNFLATSNGVKVNTEIEDGWFNPERIEFRYRMRKMNPVWMALVSKSLNLIDKINSHDWLRRRAGAEYTAAEAGFFQSLSYLSETYSHNKKFYSKTSTDVTMNSRILLADLLDSFVRRDGEIIVSCAVHNIKEKNKSVEVDSDCGILKAKNVVVCSPDFIAREFNLPVKVSYAPMIIVDNIPDTECSFVELDYQTKKCINLLKKTGGIAQAGGISVSNINEVEPYLEYLKDEHKKRNPDMRFIDSYIGLKKELVQKNENRNYLYHITKQSSRVWSVMLGKFSLAFSLGPEFYRRVYNKNPAKFFVDSKTDKHELKGILSPCSWEEISNLRGRK